MSEREYLENRLAASEADFLRTLEKHGYTTDLAAFAAGDAWDRLQREVRQSTSPSSSGYRVRRALIGLLRLRELRAALDTIEDAAAAEYASRAVRQALDLGPLVRGPQAQGDLLTDAEQLRWMRAKGSREGGRSRHRAVQDARTQVRRMAKDIRRRRKHAGSEPLNKTALARNIHRSLLQTSDVRLSDRTIRDYLSQPRKKSNGEPKAPR